MAVAVRAPAARPGPAGVPAKLSAWLTAAIRPTNQNVGHSPKPRDSTFRKGARERVPAVAPARRSAAPTAATPVTPANAAVAHRPTDKTTSLEKSSPSPRSLGRRSPELANTGPGQPHNPESRLDPRRPITPLRLLRGRPPQRPPPTDPSSRRTVPDAARDPTPSTSPRRTAIAGR